MRVMIVPHTMVIPASQLCVGLDCEDAFAIAFTARVEISLLRDLGAQVKYYFRKETDSILCKDLAETVWLY
jgi:hypothetical protein